MLALTGAGPAGAGELPLSSGLSAFYVNSGMDATGNGYNLSDTGGPIVTGPGITGGAGQAIQCDLGSDSLAVLLVEGSLTIGPSFTIAGWVNLQSSGRLWDSTTLGANVLRLDYVEDTFTFDVGGFVQVAADRIDMPSGWVCLMGVVDGTTAARLYVNGVQAASSTPGAMAQRAVTNLRICNSSDGVPMQYTYLGIWKNRALSAASALAFYNGGAGINPLA